MISDITTWVFEEMIPFCFAWIWGLLLELINLCISVLAKGLTTFAELFPDNPCGSLIASCADVGLYDDMSGPARAMYDTGLAALAWLFPMSFVVDLLTCTLMGVAAYFLIAPVLRWFKLLT